MRQAYRRRPWRVPNPGVNDEELNGGSSSTSRPPTASRRRGGLFHEGRLPLWRAAASPPSPPRPTSLPLRRAAASSTPRLPRPRPRSPSPRVSGSRDGLQPPLYSTSELRSGPGRRCCPWPRARRRRPGWRPGASLRVGRRYPAAAPDAPPALVSRIPSMCDHRVRPLTGADPGAMPLDYTRAHPTSGISSTPGPSSSRLALTG